MSKSKLILILILILITAQYARSETIDRILAIVGDKIITQY